MKSEYQYQIGDTIKNITIDADGEYLKATVGDTELAIAVHQLEAGHFVLEVNGEQRQLYTARRNSRCYVAMEGQTWLLEKRSPVGRRQEEREAAIEAELDSLTATMPGVVVEVLVTEGEHVERGQTLMLLEAMKMELRITSPHAGQVQRVYCTAGEIVERGQILVEIASD